MQVVTETMVTLGMSAHTDRMLRLMVDSGVTNTAVLERAFAARGWVKGDLQQTRGYTGGLGPTFPKLGEVGGETTRSHHGTLHGTKPALGPHRISSKTLDLRENELGATGP